MAPSGISPRSRAAPSRSRRTKWTRPSLVFLSRRISCRIRAGEIPLTAVGSPARSSSERIRAQLALGEGFEGLHVGHDRLRLMESADHVFPERVIDGGLAADR